MQQAKQQERERNEAEQVELKRHRAEARAAEKGRLQYVKFVELLTVDQALTFLWHNVGRHVLLVALKKTWWI